MKQVIIEITKCSECPHIGKMDAQVSGCFHPHAIPHSEDYDDPFRYAVDPQKIPEWCPLSSVIMQIN